MSGESFSFINLSVDILLHTHWRSINMRIKVQKNNGRNVPVHTNKDKDVQTRQTQHKFTRRRKREMCIREKYDAAYQNVKNVDERLNEIIDTGVAKVSS